MAKTLHWDAIYEIALALKGKFPNMDLEHVSLQQIYQWVLELEAFNDDPELANEEILSQIYQDWFEEILNDTK